MYHSTNYFLTTKITKGSDIYVFKLQLMTDFCEKCFQQAMHRACLRIVRRQLGYTLAVHQPMDRREAQPDATSLCPKTARNPGIFYRQGDGGRAPWAAGSG